MALVLYPFTNRHVKVIESQINYQIEVLTNEMYEFILEQSKLSPFIEAINNNHDKLALSKIESCDAKRISEAMVWLDLYLGSLGPEDTSSSIIRLISSNRLARKVLSGAYAKFLDAYRIVFEMVNDPINEYELPATLLPRSVHQVETLLAVDVQ